MEEEDLEKLLHVVEVYLSTIKKDLFNAKTAENNFKFKIAVKNYYKACYSIYDLILIVCNNLVNKLIEEQILIPLENKFLEIANRIDYIYINHMKGVLDLKRISDKLYLNKDPLVVNNFTEKSRCNLLNPINVKEKFSDIFGHETIKSELLNILKVKSSVHVRSIESTYNLNFTSNALLFAGPPGTGKRRWPQPWPTRTVHLCIP